MLCCFRNCSGVDVHFHGAQVLQLVLIPLVCRTFRQHKRFIHTRYANCKLSGHFTERVTYPAHAALWQQSAVAHYQKSGPTSISVQFVHGSRQTPKERIYSDRMPLKQCSFFSGQDRFSSASFVILSRILVPVLSSINIHYSGTLQVMLSCNRMFRWRCWALYP